MAKGPLLVEEDYIDMDISSSTTFLCYTIPSPPHSREFEFQMSSHQPQRDTTTSPADELFYKGKLLPLHLPPRLQMVQMLLQGPNTFQETTTTAAVVTTTNTAATTPFESCNISPANSCCVSGELNPEEYFHECSTGLIEHRSKKPWSRRIKSIKQSSLGLKLKASRAFLKSLFSKSRCSDEPPCAVPKAKECSDGYPKSGRRNAFEEAATIARSIDEDDSYGYRRSFSGVIKWYSTSKSSSASSSCSSSTSSSSSSSFSSANPSGVFGPQMLKRSSSVNSEVESSIQGAIAYCKKSQQPICARKSVSDVGLYSLSASRAAAALGNQERPGLCSG